MNHNLSIEPKNNIRINQFGRNLFFQILDSIGMKRVNFLMNLVYMIEWLKLLQGVNPSIKNN